MVDELPDTGEVDPGEVAEDEFDESYDPDTGELAQIVLTIEQLEELRAALNLPEGNYRLERG